MKCILALFSIIILLTFNAAYGLTASEFVSKYKNDFSSGEKIHILVKVRGEPESQDLEKRAKEIRFLQAAVLKFIHFAGAINVVSDTIDNQFTATMTIPLAEKIAKRYDVVSVTTVEDGKPGTNICSPIAAGADLSGCDLYGINLRNANLSGTNFTNANLKGADLSGANLSGADMRHAFLRYALLNGANLTDADFSHAKLIRAKITNADLSNAVFYGSVLYYADFTNSNLTGVDFRYSSLTYAILAFTNLQGANLEGAGTWNTNLNHCYNHKICE